MSIAESLRAWLKRYDGIEVDDTFTCDQLAVEAEALGLFKSPETFETVFIDGSRDVTAYYLFAVRQNTMTDALRGENETWLEDLERWVRAQNMLRSLPMLGSGRDPVSVGVSGTFSMVSQDGHDAIYEISITITYHEEVPT